MMELTLLIQKVRMDKDAFPELIGKMEPLIRKYTRLLYKDEPEDMRSELVLALWKAVVKIEYCENDGECLNFIHNALKSRFFKLYKKSRKYHDNYAAPGNGAYVEPVDFHSGMDIDDIVFRIDIERMLDKYPQKTQMILRQVLLEGKSVAETGKMFHTSRQHVNRLRKKFYLELREAYFS